MRYNVDPVPLCLTCYIKEGSPETSGDPPSENGNDKSNNRKVTVVIVINCDVRFGRRYKLFETPLPVAKGTDAVDGDDEMPLGIQLFTIASLHIRFNHPF